MWVEILCGLVFFRIFGRFFYDENEELLREDSSGSSAIFYVAKIIEKAYGGKVYVGLRIPDADSGSRQNIDMVLVAKGAVMVVSVCDFSGYLDLDKDGSWVYIGDKRGKKERLPSPVEETRRKVAILESYLAQRDLILPDGYLTGRVVLPNPSCRTTYAIECLPEVISFEKLSQIKPESRVGFSNWFKDAIRGGKDDMKEAMHQKLNFILSTAPMWDRLELKGDKNILGEFIEFKGKKADMHALRNVQRSKVSQLVIQKSTLFGGLCRPKLQVLHASRDYRIEGAPIPDWNEATVSSSADVIFQPLNSKKVRKIKLSSILSASLSAS